MIDRNDLFNKLDESASWSTGVTFSRTNPLPIDKYSIFKSYEDAEDYAKLNAVAYPSQIIAVIDDKDSITHYSIQIDGSLKALASGSSGEVSGEPIPSTVIASIFDGTFTPVPEEDRPENVIPDSTINDIINGTFGG